MWLSVPLLKLNLFRVYFCKERPGERKVRQRSYAINFPIVRSRFQRRKEQFWIHEELDVVDSCSDRTKPLLRSNAARLDSNVFPN